MELGPTGSTAEEMASDARLYISRPANIPTIAFQFEDIDESLLFHFLGWKSSMSSLSAESCRLAEGMVTKPVRQCASHEQHRDQLTLGDPAARA